MSEHTHVTAPTFDVIIIGAGAAGLSGALALGRSRRRTLVLDGGSPRNATAGHVHNYLGREGTPPGELVALGRGEVEAYGVEVRDAPCTDVARLGDGSFVVTAGGEELTARRVLVATGLVDVLPDVPGISEGWGSKVLHCPYCHGWEVRDRAIGVLATSPMSVHQVQLFRQLTSDVVLFLNDAFEPGEEVAEQLSARDVAIVKGAVEGWEDGGVRLRSGELFPREVLVISAPVEARLDGLTGLGLESSSFEMNGVVFGSYLTADAMGQTAVPGVWAAGNVSDPRATVIASAAAGLAVAAAINMDLVNEDVDLAVQRRRLFGEQAWEERYRETPKGRWSGNPNPVLVQEISGSAPGSALDVGCGEGGDAIWLAREGWRVTGTDISSVALARAATAADDLEIAWQHVDLIAEPPTPRSFDLVTAHFMQLPRRQRVELYHHLAEAVATGGTLLLVGHDPSDMHAGVGRPHLHDMFFTAVELATELSEEDWRIEVAEARPRLTKDADGKEVTIKDAVLRAVRLR